MLVGVNAGHLKEGLGQNSGLSYFVKSSTIHEILKRHLNAAQSRARLGKLRFRL